MKVIFLPNNTASLMTTMIPKMREKGIKAVGFNFAPLVIQNSEFIENFPQKGGGAVLFASRLSFFFKFLYHLFTADVVHWVYGSGSFRASLILKFVSIFKKNKFVEYCGTDIRSLEKLCEDVSFYQLSDFDKKQQLDLGTTKSSFETQKKFSKLNFKALPNSPELIDYIDKKITTEFYEVSRSIDLKRFPFVGISKSEIPLVVHIPSNPSVKGTKFITSALEKLKSEGLIEYHYINGVSHTEAIRALKNADIVIDQILIGEYGVLSIEAMALGKPVLCFIRPKLWSHYIKLDPSFPIVNVNITNIEEKLRDVVLDKNRRDKISLDGRTYVEKFHDGEKNAEKLIDIYQQTFKAGL